ncbi:hypothetical protein [Alteripontixanthobacter maritimus]|uniref:hypothetical protein n=1 Tax=Alteripontixanthobacter maritimus TaxID=2161824 RepID=UPI0038994143
MVFESMIGQFDQTRNSWRFLRGVRIGKVGADMYDARLVVRYGHVRFGSIARVEA